MIVIPETASTKDWPRKVKQAVEAVAKRVLSLETRETFTFAPTTEPASPTAGMTYYDSGTNKLRCWDGSAWNDLW